MLIHQSADSVSNTYHTVRYSNYRRRLHFHRGYEFVHVLSGQVELTVDDHREVLDAGTFACVLSNQPHAIYSQGESLIWICCFSTDFLPDFHNKVKNCTGDSFIFRCNPLLLRYFREQLFPYEDHEGNLLDLHKLKGSLHLLCNAFLSSVSLSERDNTRFAMMNIISDYIEKNYSQKLDMQDVATAFGYEYSYFSKLFRSIFSVPFPEFVNSYRCGAAVELLRKTDESLASVAKKSGFQSVRTFNYVFHKQMGITPTEFVKQLKASRKSS